MANIVDITYFEGGELNISGTEKLDVSEKVTKLILKYEPDYLQRVLGYPLFKLFVADAYPTPVTARFVDIMNGKEFTDCNGFVKKWPGLKATILCPIADYVYYWYTRDNVSFQTVMGESKGSSENANTASPMTKQCRAWNQMVDTTWMLWEYLQANTTIYPEFDINQADVRRFQKINVLNI